VSPLVATAMPNGAPIEPPEASTVVVPPEAATLKIAGALAVVAVAGATPVK
jgi:hypothetical protein